MGSLFLLGLLSACQTATPRALPDPTTEATTGAQGAPALTPPAITTRTISNPTEASSVALRWQPTVGQTWQWQISVAEVEPIAGVEVYDLDAFATSAETVAALHAQGSWVICYISVGSWEDWRPDAGDFPEAVIGKDYEGWPGEKWLDIRQIEALAPVMQARLDMCRDKGFDGVEPDNIDGYWADSGFELTAEDQLRYDRWLAAEAHARGLTIGLKNSPEHAAALVDEFDWALTEGCFVDEWCEEVLVFIEAGKPVFATEYAEADAEARWDEFCAQAQDWGVSLILKNLALDVYREDCP